MLYSYDIGAARHEIDDLFWKDFCDNYIEIVKSRLYEPGIHGYEERKSGQYALYYALFNILKLYSIYVPHITDHIYQSFFKRHEKTISIHLTHWAKPTGIDGNLMEFGEQLKNTMFEVRKYKSERNLSMKTEMDKLVINTIPKFAEWFKETEKDLLACTNAKKLEFC